MPFFQNPFDQEFRGNLLLGDRQHILTFTVPANRNRSDLMMAFNAEPYDFSSVNTLTINYAYDQDFKNYSSVAINVAGSTPAATTAAEVVTILNAHAVFSTLFVASSELVTISGISGQRVVIKSLNRPRQAMRVYLANTGAETKLKFNQHAGVGELPTFFSRHTIANRFSFDDCVGLLVELDVGETIDQAIITDAGLDYSNEQADWELLRGRSGLFMFRKVTVDGDDRITSIIEYSAGSVAGDLAKKITYSFTGANLNPDQITEEPYVLTGSDLVTP